MRIDKLETLLELNDLDGIIRELSQKDKEANYPLHLAALYPESPDENLRLLRLLRILVEKGKSSAVIRILCLQDANNSTYGHLSASRPAKKDTIEYLNLLELLIENSQGIQVASLLKFFNKARKAIGHCIADFEVLPATVFSHYLSIIKKLPNSEQVQLHSQKDSSNQNIWDKLSIRCKDDSPKEPDVINCAPSSLIRDISFNVYVYTDLMGDFLACISKSPYDVIKDRMELTDRDLNTIIHSAVYAENDELTQNLLKQLMRVVKKDPKGAWTILAKQNRQGATIGHCIVKFSSLSSLRLYAGILMSLLEKGYLAKVDALLYLENREGDNLESLIGKISEFKKRLDFHELYEQINPLMRFIISGDLENDLNKIPDSTDPSFSVVKSKIDLAVAEILQPASARLMQLALLKAAQLGFSKSCLWLVEHKKVDINYQDAEGNSAQHVAVKAGKIETARTLKIHAQKLDKDRKLIDRRGKDVAFYAPKEHKDFFRNYKAIVAPDALVAVENPSLASSGCIGNAVLLAEMPPSVSAGMVVVSAELSLTSEPTPLVSSTVKAYSESSVDTHRVERLLLAINRLVETESSDTSLTPAERFDEAEMCWLRVNKHISDHALTGFDEKLHVASIKLALLKVRLEYYRQQQIDELFKAIETLANTARHSEVDPITRYTEAEKKYNLAVGLIRQFNEQFTPASFKKELDIAEFRLDQLKKAANTYEHDLKAKHLADMRKVSQPKGSTSAGSGSTVATAGIFVAMPKKKASAAPAKIAQTKAPVKTLEHAHPAHSIAERPHTTSLRFQILGVAGQLSDMEKPFGADITPEIARLAVMSQMLRFFVLFQQLKGANRLIAKVRHHICHQFEDHFKFGARMVLLDLVKHYKESAQLEALCAYAEGLQNGARIPFDEKPLRTYFASLGINPDSVDEFVDKCETAEFMTALQLAINCLKLFYKRVDLDPLINKTPKNVAIGNVVLFDACKMAIIILDMALNKSGKTFELLASIQATTGVTCEALASLSHLIQGMRNELAHCEATIFKVDGAIMSIEEIDPAAIYKMTCTLFTPKDSAPRYGLR